jgi:hypothetical protein
MFIYTIFYIIFQTKLPLCKFFIFLCPDLVITFKLFFFISADTITFIPLLEQYHKKDGEKTGGWNVDSRCQGRYKAPCCASDAILSSEQFWSSGS